MRAYQTCPPPILRQKPKPIDRSSILPIPQPPTQHREPPKLIRAQNTLTIPAVRVLKTLKESIDYDKLTPTQQLKWDAGMYGSIELKTIKGHQYYYLRWYEPTTGRLRSTYLAKDWEKAKEKLQKMTQNPE